MVENLDQAVCTAVIETFENMTFMEVLSLLSVEDPEPVLLESLGVSLPVTEPFEGHFSLFLPRLLLTDIAETVYVMGEDQIDAGILHDILAELLNTIAGKILQEALPEDQLFSLGLPQAVKKKKSEPGQVLQKWFFEVQESLFCVTFSGEKPVS